MTVLTHSFSLGGKDYSFETGRLALQAQGAAFVQHGETALLVTAGVGDAREGIDFFPLVVDFEAKYYASGKIKGSRFIKREGRPPESAILTARMIDRTMRPLFPKGITNEVQVIGNLMQTDGLRNVGPTAMTAASLAVAMTGMPIEGLFAGVRVGRNEAGEFILDPTFEECENGGMDLIVAGTADAITMVEAGMNIVDEETVLKALEFAHEAIKTLCAEQAKFVGQMTIEPKEVTYAEKSMVEVDAVAETVTEEMLSSVSGVTKAEVKKKLKAIETPLLEKYAAQIEDESMSKGKLKSALNDAFSAYMRKTVLSTGKRVDGRTPTEVRPLSCEVGLLPRLHGSALFQRGETQAMTVATVGGPSDVKLIDDADRPEFEQQYLHHYNFPPYSVGEVRRLRSPGRREIGHGLLAQRALEPVVPRKSNGFPYTLRLVSEILTCNGSSSMASVCGSTLSLMDAGIPLRAPIAGVAMGLMMDKETGDYKILTDIQGLEDFDGDMDLKVTGSRDGLTALQMDIKVKGLKIELLREAFAQAKVAKDEILDAMLATIKEPRAEMSAYAPRITTMQIDPDMIRVVIGKGGETIQKICAEYEVKIDIEDDGTVMIQSVDQAKAKGAEQMIQALVYEPKEGDVFPHGIVKSVMDFGVFVEYLPNKEALVHVSEMADHRVNHPSDEVSEGDVVRVKMIGMDKMGRVKLSMKQAKEVVETKAHDDFDDLPSA